MNLRYISGFFKYGLSGRIPDILFNLNTRMSAKKIKFIPFVRIIHWPYVKLFVKACI